MGIEERLLDVLQNIEAAIVGVHETSPDLSDYDVMEGLDAVIALYRAEFRGQTPKSVTLQQQEAEIFERVKAMCEWRMGRASQPEVDNPVPVEATSVDDILSCLRKIRKSVERWNDRGGRQGYLNFIREYVR